MTLVFEIGVAILLAVGGLFGLIGSVGLWKLRAPMQRLHAPTKASTLGVGAVLVASVLDMWVFQDQVTWQELLIVIFIFLTAPVSALFLAKVHLHLTVQRRDLPPTGTGADWATYEDRTDG